MSDRSNPDKNVSLDASLLGYVERRVGATRGKPGDIGFDDLGNAQYQWKDDRMLEETEAGNTRRHRALAVANLTLVDDEQPTHFKTAQLNKDAKRLGYNPYESGQIPKAERKKPRDLRALSKWIEAQKLAGQNFEPEE